MMKKGMTWFIFIIAIFVMGCSNSPVDNKVREYRKFHDDRVAPLAKIDEAFKAWYFGVEKWNEAEFNQNTPKTIADIKEGLTEVKRVKVPAELAKVQDMTIVGYEAKLKYVEKFGQLIKQGAPDGNVEKAVKSFQQEYLEADKNIDKSLSLWTQIADKYGVKVSVVEGKIDIEPK